MDIYYKDDLLDQLTQYCLGNPAMICLPIGEAKNMVAAYSTKLGASAVISIAEALERTRKATSLQRMLEG